MQDLLNTRPRKIAGPDHPTSSSCRGRVHSTMILQWELHLSIEDNPQFISKNRKLKVDVRHLDRTHTDAQN